MKFGVAAGEPFEHFTRAEWEALGSTAPLPLTAEDIAALASLGDPIDLAEVDAIYRPLSAVLQLYVDAIRRIGTQQLQLLRSPLRPPTPFVIGVAGSVAVGKSTVSRLLQLLLSRWPRTPHVDLVTTDGFLYPNDVLQKRGLMERKGFPESYDRAALLDFLAAVKSGASQVSAPVYSHVTYDIVPEKRQVVSSPDILIIEGLNVLQPARTHRDGSGVTVADYFDFRIYVDADPSAVEQWYIDRFLQLRRTSFPTPESYFRSYATLSNEEAVNVARQIWRTINLPNLVENIAPTRPRATLVLHKDPNHHVDRISLRKI